MKLLLLSAILFSYSLPALAKKPVVFMVNLNYSRQEMEAAQKVAESRGQEFVTIPPAEIIRAADRNFVEGEALKRELKKNRGTLTEQDAESVFYTLNYLASFTDPEARKKYENQVFNTPEKKALADKFSKKFTAYNAEKQKIKAMEKALPNIRTQLEEISAKLKTDKKKVDSMVISGHSNGTNLSGESGLMLNRNDFVDIQKKYPDMSPRHLLLMGCYTATDQARKSWREGFPKASLIAGFDNIAPLRTRPASSAYIIETMATADRLDREQLANGIKPEKQIQEAFKALESFRQTNASLDYCHAVVDKRPPGSEACDKQWQDFIPLVNQIHADYFASPPKKDPPEQTQGTELRAFYTQLQRICDVRTARSIASTQVAEWERYRATAIDQTIRLIFWRNVQKNYSRYYEKDLKAAQAILDKSGVGVKIPKLDGTTGWVEYNQFIRNTPWHKIARNESDKVYQLLSNLTRLNPSTIPFGWVEPDVVHGPRN